MSTQTHPTSRPHRTPEPTIDATKRRPAGRTIVASVVAGAVAALVLALVVFAGGTEATITGALLLGFGFGWALMATLTVRRTRQPQRWAVVPAVAMGATGTALVVFSPGNETITALNWVWPPLMVALAAWMFVQMRRSVTGQGALGAHPGDRGAGPGLDRRHLRQHRAHRRPGHLRRPGEAVRRRRPPAPPGLPRPRLPHRRALQRARRGLRRPGRGSPPPSQRPPGSAPTTAPDRAGATTPRAPRTASSRPRTCTRSSPRPASTAPTCWSGTPPAGPTR